MAKLTVAVIGAGSRGNSYSNYFKKFPDEGQVVAVAEPRKDYRARLAAQHGIPSERQFRDWRKLVACPKLADAAFLCTPDRLHHRPAIALAGLGYHLLLEKPMAPTLKQCRQIAEAVANAGVMCAVCHVLRYTNQARAIRQMIADGLIGDVANIQLLEQVGYWHQAHSFVRGNWRNERESSSMLLAKCCHDLDWISFFAASPCVKIGSYGSLMHFTRARQPAGAADRCTACPPAVERNCPYSAVRYYLEVMKGRETTWPSAVLTLDQTPEGIGKALETGPYGRCVYACDNDVVDHQVVSMEFASGATASHTMTAFTLKGNRLLRIHGTRGEIIYDDAGVTHNDFLTRSSRLVDTSPKDQTAASGHGGGDFGLVRGFVAALRQNDPSRIDTDVQTSLATHAMVFAAEEARKKNKSVTMTGKFDVQRPA